MSQSAKHTPATLADEFERRADIALEYAKFYYGTVAAAFRERGKDCHEAAALLRETTMLREAIKQGGWQPIETAPKDGITFLGGYFNQPRAERDREGRVVKCWFQPEFDAFISSCRQMTMAPGYTIDGKTSKLHSPNIEDVSHWMPLPSAPAIKQDGQTV